MAFLLVIVLFAVLLTVKKFIKKNFCVICLAVSLSWMSLLVLYYLGLYGSVFIIALLMGHTSLGVYYIAEKKAEREFLVFRLPFLLTLMLIMVTLLEPALVEASLVLALGVVWLVFVMLYAWRNVKWVRNMATRVIECCGNW